MARLHYGLTGGLFYLISIFCLGGCNSSPAPDATATEFRPVKVEKKTTPASNEPTTQVAETSPATNGNIQPSLPMTTEGALPPSNDVAATPGSPIPGEKNTTTNETGKPEKSESVPVEYVQMLRQMDQLANSQPRGTTREQQAQSAIRILMERLQIAEALAKDPKAPDTVKDEANQVRLQSYIMLMQAGQPEAKEALEQLCTELTNSKNPKLAAVGKIQMFSMKMMDFFELKPDNAQPAIAAIDQLLTDVGQEEMAFEATIRVLQMLSDKGFEKESKNGIEKVTSHFVKHHSIEIAMQSRMLQLNSIISELDSKDVEKNKAVTEKIIGKLSEISKNSTPQLDPQISQMILQVANMLEGIGDGSQAAPIYEFASTTFAESKNEAISTNVKDAVSKSKLRLGLVGKPFDLEGVLLDGAKFDWSAYKGKIVLIDFWATWCGPCLQEMGNIKKNYTKYHEQGFEVVGVNLDEEMEQVNAFFEKQQLPWTTIFSANEKERGFENPMAVKCGIDSIPFVILLGRDGKVAGIHVRGERLEQELAAIFGETNAPAATTPEQPKEKDAQRNIPENSLR